MVGVIVARKGLDVVFVVGVTVKDSLVSKGLRNGEADAGGGVPKAAGFVS